MQTHDIQLVNKQWTAIPAGSSSVTLVDVVGAGEAYWRFAGDTTEGILFSKTMPVRSPVAIEVKAIPHNMVAKIVRA